MQLKPHPRDEQNNTWAGFQRDSKMRFSKDCGHLRIQMTEGLPLYRFDPQICRFVNTFYDDLLTTNVRPEDRSAAATCSHKLKDRFGKSGPFICIDTVRMTREESGSTTSRYNLLEA